MAVLTDIGDVPEPPTADRLRISGCSVVVHFAHRLTEGSDFPEAFTGGGLREIEDDRSYQSKVRPGSGLMYSALFDAGALPAALARIVGSGHSAGLRQAAVTLGGEYVVTALPLLLSVPGPITQEAAVIELSSPLTIDTLLRFVSLLGDPDIARILAEQSAEELARAAGLARDDIDRTWLVEGSIAVQVWNLDGTQNRATGDLYRGVEESADYAWEISALLSYATEDLDLGPSPEASVIPVLDRIAKAVGKTPDSLTVSTHSVASKPMHSTLIELMRGQGSEVLVPERVTVEPPYLLSLIGLSRPRIDTMIGAIGLSELVFAAGLIDLIAPDLGFTFRLASIAGPRAEPDLTNLDALFNFSEDEEIALREAGWDRDRPYTSKDLVRPGTSRASALFAVTDNPALGVSGPRPDEEGVVHVEGFLVKPGARVGRIKLGYRR
ncbi:hypothetical protein ABZ608_09320 [Streptomyces sp. NPDC013172]|uniref:hypothetical protein n=1 Tax=Streptomyces sp. NPDC013172 TaxID=3155009 RepID=UPI0033DDA888